MESLSSHAARALARPAAARAIEFDGIWHSWGEMAACAAAITRHLSGVAPGAIIALVSRNHPATIAALLGLIAHENSIAMVYGFQSPAGIARDLARIAPAAFVLTQADDAPEIRAECARQGIPAIALHGMAPTLIPAAAKPQSANAAATATGEPHIAILTSGTTGPPKHFPIPFAMIARHHIAATPLPEAPPSLLYMPLGNISGIYTTLPALLNGQNARLLERFSIASWVDYVRTFRPASHGVPPSMLQALLDADIPAADLASLKSMGSGAAPLAPAVQTAFEDRYGIPVLVSYGATEFGGPVAGMSLDLHRVYGRAKLGSVGRAMPGCGLRIVDSVSGAPLPPGAEGRIEVHAPRIAADWIATADIGHIDADGFVFIHGRADGAIMRGGFKLLPESIETALLLHPAVAEAAVVVVADARVGQVPGAMVRLGDDIAGAVPAALAAHLRQHLPATHLPAHWRIVSELPRNPSLKIDRAAITRIFAEM